MVLLQAQCLFFTSVLLSPPPLPLPPPPPIRIGDGKGEVPAGPVGRPVNAALADRLEDVLKPTDYNFQEMKGFLLKSGWTLRNASNARGKTVPAFYCPPDKWGKELSRSDVDKTMRSGSLNKDYFETGDDVVAFFRGNKYWKGEMAKFKVQKGV